MSFGVIRSRLLASGRAVRGAREAAVARLENGEKRGGRRRRYPINETFFDCGGPAQNYVVGLFQADGTNYPSRGRMSLTLKREDAGLLRELATVFGSKGRPLYENKSGGMTLEITSKRLSTALSERGVASPKTHTASTHDDLLLDRDYWRGVVDGDGSLCNTSSGRHVLSLVGSMSICSEFLEFCRNRGLGQRRSVTRHKSIWSTGLSGSEAVSMAGILYANAGISLARKRNRALAWTGHR